jgi:hypothetical protein
MTRFHVGVFTLYEDAEHAVDELGVRGVAEDALNAIASAEALRTVGLVENMADRGKTQMDHLGELQILDDLLLRGEQVYLPDTGSIVATGKRAAMLVESTFRMFGDTASFAKTLMTMGIGQEGAREISRLIHKGGTAVLIDERDAADSNPQRVFMDNNASISVAVTGDEGGGQAGAR